MELSSTNRVKLVYYYLWRLHKRTKTCRMFYDKGTFGKSGEFEVEIISVFRFFKFSQVSFTMTSLSSLNCYSVFRGSVADGNRRIDVFATSFSGLQNRSMLFSNSLAEFSNTNQNAVSSYGISALFSILFIFLSIFLHDILCLSIPSSEVWNFHLRPCFGFLVLESSAWWTTLFKSLVPP